MKHGSVKFSGFAGYRAFLPEGKNTPGAPPLQPEEANLMVEHCSTYGK